MPIQINIFLPVLLLLIGCTRLEITNPPVDVPLEDEQVAERYEPVRVRSFFGQRGGSSVEFAGAQCTLTDGGFAVNFSSPAIVNVPIFAQGGKALQARCQFQGKLATRTVTPRRNDPQATLSLGSRHRNVGVGLKLPLDHALGLPDPLYDYPDISVLFKSVATTAQAKNE